MNEHEKWDWGVAVIRKEYKSLSHVLKCQLKLYAAKIKSCKQTLHLAAEGAGAGEICGECLGECCNCGKNHVTVVDLLVYFSDAKEKLFTPRFERDICPYLGENGCLMGPEYRPYNCITFICDRIEGGLEPLEKERFYAAERELRSLYEGFEQLFDNSFRYGLLRNCERSLGGNSAPILRGAALTKKARINASARMRR